LKEFGLQRVRKSRGDLLSGGEEEEQKSPGLFAVKPNFILLDGPFAGVDPIAVEEFNP